MKKSIKKLTFLIVILLSDASSYCQAYISGNIANYNNKKITIRYSSDGFLTGNSSKIKTQTDGYGNFSINTDHLYSLGTYNWIKIDAKDTYYFSLEPYDSLAIDIDPKNAYLNFSGKNSDRSYYCNDYYHDLRKRKSVTNALISQNSVEKVKHDYEYELLFLKNCSKKYNLDLKFYEYMKEYLKYSYINTLSIDGFDTTSIYKEVLKEFNLHNEILKYNAIYYSSMVGYYKDYLGINLDLMTIEGLKESFISADSINEHPYSEIFKAYMITYFIAVHKNKKILNSTELNKMIIDYLALCKDQVVKLEVEEMMNNYSLK